MQAGAQTVLSTPTCYVTCSAGSKGGALARGFSKGRRVTPL